MNVSIEITVLICLFIALGMSADFTVVRTRYIASKLKLPIFIVGIILGIMTTLPELAVGINSLIDNVPEIAVGNLLGGIIVTFGLIIGLNLVLNHGIRTTKILNSLIPLLIVLVSPILLGIDGRYNLLDGVILICLYLALVVYLYIVHPQLHNTEISSINEKRLIHSIFLTIANIAFVLAITRAIVEVSSDILRNLHISEMVIGLVIFAVGTNLPEILVTITSWKRKMSQLSFSYLISSAFTNILVLGILATIKTLNFQVDKSFLSISFFLILSTLLFIYFSFTGKNLSRKEGALLLIIYILFVGSTLYFGS